MKILIVNNMVNNSKGYNVFIMLLMYLNEAFLINNILIKHVKNKGSLNYLILLSYFIVNLLRFLYNNINILNTH